MGDKSAKALRKTDEKNAKSNKKAPKGAIAAKGEGYDKSGMKKAAKKKKAKKA
jgi:hypothetical protein